VLVVVLLAAGVLIGLSHEIRGVGVAEYTVEVVGPNPSPSAGSGTLFSATVRPPRLTLTNWQNGPVGSGVTNKPDWYRIARS
jgi:hypothetical protein